MNTVNGRGYDNSHISINIDDIKIAAPQPGNEVIDVIYMNHRTLASGLEVVEVRAAYVGRQQLAEALQGQPGPTIYWSEE